MSSIINADTSDGLKFTSDTSGEIKLQSAGADIATVSSTGIAMASGKTLPAAALTGTLPSGTNVISSGTSVASTSGTSIDFTSIPSWVKRITVMFNGVSLSGTAHPLIQLGTGGTATTTGYVSSATITATTSLVLTSTSGFIMYVGTAAYAPSGNYIFNLVSGNIWVGSGALSNSASAAFTTTSGGVVTLGGVLNMVRITTSNGTDTFDAGSINILYE